jgi:transposase
MQCIQGSARDQLMLLPTRVEDYVHPDNPVRAIDGFVDSLDLAQLQFPMKAEGSRGRPPFAPADLLKLYLYGYLQRLRSSRQLERACYYNLEVIWLLRELKPDHCVISEFRRLNAERFKAVLRQFNLVALKLGLFGCELVAIDGSYLKAVNSGKRNWTQGQLRKLLEAIEGKVTEYLQTLESTDAAEGPSAMGSGEPLREKLARLQEEQMRAQALMEQAQRSVTGQVSLTDPDSRRLKKRRQSVVGYNAQIAVDGRAHLIVEARVTQASDDSQQLAPMAAASAETLPRPEGMPLRAVADAGYYNIDQLVACEKTGVLPCVPEGGPKGRAAGCYGLERFDFQASRDCYCCPGGAELRRQADSRDGSGNRYRTYANVAACRRCGLRGECTRGRYRKLHVHEQQAAKERAAQRLRTEPGLMRQRASVVEHVFGTIKFWWGHGSLLTRGLKAVGGEFTLSCLAYNLRRVLNEVGVGALKAACL